MYLLWSGNKWQSQAELPNRGFRYGDGVFETIQLVDGQAPYLPDHLSRLTQGLDFLFIRYHAEELHQTIGQLCQRLPRTKHATLRIWAYRQGAGAYPPIHYDVELQAAWSDNPHFVAVRTGSIAVSKWVSLLASRDGQYKTMNSIPYIRAAEEAKQCHLLDVVIPNHLGNIAEASSSNIFVLREGVWLTPSLDQGCVSGIRRKVVLERMATLGTPHQVQPIPVTYLFDCQGIVLTNSNQLKRVDRVDEQAIPLVSLSDLHTLFAMPIDTS